MKKTIRIATRKSPLALWQAKYVKHAMLTIDADLDIHLVGLATQGDKEQTKALTDVGGKLLFVKELQKALLNNKADIAVHSIKDLSVQNFPGLKLAAICAREDPRDVFISPRYSSITDLPQAAVVGTASPRRTALLKHQRPDLQIKLLRGNIGTRLNRCEQGDFDATILAAAGLKRLRLDHYIKAYLDPTFFIPAIGQGAIGIECREDDAELSKLIHTINHSETALCVTAERAVNRVLGGDCHTPLGAYAVIDHQQIHLRSMIGSLKDEMIIRDAVVGSLANAAALGEALGQQLLKKGANKLLKG